MHTPSGHGAYLLLYYNNNCKNYLHRHTYWLAVAACVSAVLFFVRFALYLYEPIAGKYLHDSSDVLYPYMYYEIPELVPGALILFAMRHLRAQSAVNAGSIRHTRDLANAMASERGKQEEEKEEEKGAEEQEVAVAIVAAEEARGLEARVHAAKRAAGDRRGDLQSDLRGGSSSGGSSCGSKVASISSSGSRGDSIIDGFGGRRLKYVDEGVGHCDVHVHERTSSLDAEVMGGIGPGRLPSLSALGGGAGGFGCDQSLSPGMLLHPAPAAKSSKASIKVRQQRRQAASVVGKSEDEDEGVTEPLTGFSRMS